MGFNMDPVLATDIEKVKIVKRRMDNAILNGAEFDEVKMLYQHLNILIAELDAKWALYEERVEID